AMPAWASVPDETVTTVTKRRGEQSGKWGTFVNTRTQIYRWIATGGRNVVALFRSAHKSWLDNIMSGDISTMYRGGGVGWNTDVVSSAVAAVGADTLLWYLWRNTFTHVIGADTLDTGTQALKTNPGYDLADVQAAAAGTGCVGCYDISWGVSGEMVLIDLARTGEAAIIGTVPITEPERLGSMYSWARTSSGMTGWSMTDQRVDLFETPTRSFHLQSGEDIEVDVKGMIYTVSPLILDLTGHGKPDLLAGSSWRLRPDRQLAQAALRDFDLDGTGQAIWEWAGPKSGLLVWDPDKKGQITSGKQLFGNYTWGKRWKNGYEPLATLDRNQDGWLTGPELAPLSVWVDGDSNAVSAPAEVHPVQRWGIDAICARASSHDPQGNAWASRGFRRTLPNGQRRQFATWDWISYGVAKNAGGTYVWVGKDGEKDIGGILRLRNDNGQVRGLSIPAISVTNPLSDIKVKLEKYESKLNVNLVAALPVAGRTQNSKLIKWRTPAPRGSQAESEVLLAEGGKHLYGRTHIVTPQKKWSYEWQAELVAGQPLSTSTSVRN
ncbi:MAG: hypothetical protein HY692_02825, partial [Cyanobacteria bacterium NC_groundwater_1444_Ag_S-0.65um_54_12]|nr:hypothetical protein [Cyanobacteria bacterium NC_groundwater_1444_Ag_S-0.65um_54_12]